MTEKNQIARVVAVAVLATKLAVVNVLPFARADSGDACLTLPLSTGNDRGTDGFELARLLRLLLDLGCLAGTAL
jgi:hypothetical protein